VPATSAGARRSSRRSWRRNLAIDPAIRKELRELLDGDVAFDVELWRHTSLRVGGPADALARPGTNDALVRLLALCRAHALPTLALGAGFNLLVRDGGYRGVAIQLHALRELRLEPDGTLFAGAGVRHTSVSRFCLEHARAGLEFAVGIPGTVGGWMAMNAGTREREMKDVVESLLVVEPGARAPRELRGAELRFRYRSLELEPGSFVVAARLRTEPDAPERIRARTSALLAARRESQPVDRLSCGSVFKNPPGEHAGRLIEGAGLKGHREGDAEISSVHANFIVNRGAASAADVLALIELARREVAARFGIELETEVQIVGEPA
jgi:UDP-N-acetylmuramate dehydrogenase